MNKANTYLIEQIKQRIEGPVADTLSDILPLSKEAIYRRLRGEVLFSLDEAVVVAKEFNISLDALYQKDNKYGTFELSIPMLRADVSQTYVEGYNFFIDMYDKYITEGSEFIWVRPSIPAVLISNYEKLYRFYCFRWFYITRELKPFVKKFKDIIITKDLQDTGRRLYAKLESIDHTFLMSAYMFQFFVEEIAFFHDLNVLDKEDVLALVDELHTFINDIEVIAATGGRENGTRMNIYLMDGTIDVTFGFLVGGKKDVTLFKFMDVGFGLSEDKNLYTLCSKLFYDMKGYSTLISESGSAPRAAFFRKQRVLLNEFVLKYS